MKKPTLKAIYEEANIMAEKWSKIVVYAFIYVSLPMVTVPYLVFSFHSYFGSDAGRNAFRLPFLSWYDHRIKLT